MTVSVVIPTYNGAEFIGRTLKAVLGQTFTELEIVIADDGSTDSTLEVVRSVADARVQITHDCSRVGAEGNWNRALANASGEFIKLLPQDDLIYPHNIEVQVAALQAHPTAALAATRRDVIARDDAVLVKDRGLSGLCGLADRVSASRRVIRSGANPIGEGGAVLFRKEAVDVAGGFDGSLPYVIDVDYWLRLLDWGPVFGICETHVAFRVSSGAWSTALAKAQGAQYAEFIERIASDSTRNITRSDIMIGKTRARLNGLLRRAFYIRHRSRL